MFCGNSFTSTDLQNHKKNHMKNHKKRFNWVNRALFLNLSNEFEEQKLIPKVAQKNFGEILGMNLCFLNALLKLKNKAYLPSGNFLVIFSCGFSCDFANQYLLKCCHKTYNSSKY